MAGVKGRSGTNKGQDKPWAEALRRVCYDDTAEGKRRLVRLAEKCVAMAEAGDMQALKEIGDRLDGKPHQTSDMTITRTVARELSDDELADIAAGDSEPTHDGPVH
jgi:cytochrome c553